MPQKQIVLALRSALSQLCPPTYKEQLNVLARQERRDTKVSTRVSTDEARAVRRIRGYRKH